MKFSTTETIEAAASSVFTAFSDVTRFEKAAEARGAVVERLDEMHGPGLGASWRASFAALGKRRDLSVAIVQYTPPFTLSIDSRSPGMFAAMRIEIAQIDTHRSRVGLQLDLKPKNLSGRLLIQSVRLSKASLNRRFKDRIARFAKEIEEGYQASKTLQTRSGDSRL